MKYILLAIALLAFACSLENTSSKKGPKYEKVPLIERHDSPLDITFHNRVELMKADPKTQFNYIMAQKKKISLRSELVREFTVKSLSNWLDHLAAQDLNMIHKGEFMEDMSNLKGFSKILQSHIIGKANSIMDKLTLMDLKLKEQKLIEQEIQSINQHPGDISSNLGSNLPWKERLEEIVNNSASIHTEFDVNLKGICNVIRKVNLFVENMNRTYMDSKQIHQPGPEHQYYPTDQQVLDNKPIVHALGPKVGHIAHFNKNKHAINNNLKNVDSIEKTIINSSKDSIIREIKKNILPEIKKEISLQVREEVRRSVNNMNLKSMIEDIAEKETKISNIPHRKDLLPTVKKKFKHSINRVSKKIAGEAAAKIAQNNAIKKSENIIQRAAVKIAKGKNVEKEQKQIENSQKLVNKIIKKKIDIVKRNLPESLANKGEEGKRAVEPIVNNSVGTALEKLKPKNLNKNVQKALKKVAVKNALRHVKNDDEYHSIKKKLNKVMKPQSEYSTIESDVGKATAKMKPLLKKVNKALVKAHNESIKAEKKVEHAKSIASEHPEQPDAENAKVVAKKKAAIAHDKFEILHKGSQKVKKELEAVKSGKQNPQVGLENAKNEIEKTKSKIHKIPQKITTEEMPRHKVEENHVELPLHKEAAKKVNKFEKLAKQKSEDAKSVAKKALKIADKTKEIANNNPNDRKIQKEKVVAEKNAEKAIKKSVLLEDVVHKAKREAKAVKHGKIPAHEAVKKVVTASEKVNKKIKNMNLQHLPDQRNNNSQDKEFKKIEKFKKLAKEKLQEAKSEARKEIKLANYANDFVKTHPKEPRAEKAKFEIKRRVSKAISKVNLINEVVHQVKTVEKEVKEGREPAKTAVQKIIDNFKKFKEKPPSLVKYLK